MREGNVLQIVYTVAFLYPITPHDPKLQLPYVPPQEMVDK